MPSRIIRDGIIESVAVNNLPWNAELFYRRLMSVVDDYGRYSALPQLLVSRCYPPQVDKVSTDNIKEWLQLCREQGLIALYESIEGKPLLEIQHFNQRTRTPSKFPENSAISVKGITNDCRLTVEDEGEDEVVVDSKPKTKAKKRASGISDDWEPTDSHKARAVSMGLDIAKAADYYRNWCNSKGVEQVCWNSAFTNALSWLSKRDDLLLRANDDVDSLGREMKKWS